MQVEDKLKMLCSFYQEDEITVKEFSKRMRRVKNSHWETFDSFDYSKHLDKKHKDEFEVFVLYPQFPWFGGCV